MGRTIKVSVNNMDSDIARINELIGQIPNNLKMLENTMHSLSTCWEGPAWISFQNQVAEDVEYMNEFLQFLNDYNSNFDQGKKTYLNAEKKVNSLVKKIK